MREGKINVLIVEDSAVARELLIHILTADPRISVGGHAIDGAKALEELARFKPDVITMDIHMPGMDGYEVTRRIMETQPVPIIIVSASHDADDVTKTFRAMEAGAVAAVEKPRGPAASDHHEHARKLIDMVKAMAEVKVVRRWPHTRQSVRTKGPLAPPITPSPAINPLQLVAIGASTGGPPVLQAILSSLPKPFPVPILIVQHISAGFVEGMADWLSKSAGMPVVVARDGDRLSPGHVYLAPDDHQMGIRQAGWIQCTAQAPENGLRPAVSFLFRSVAAAYGRNAVGVILTGMGRDGAVELKAMRECGAMTIAQDKESSVVHGMPGAAIEIGAATYVLPSDGIAPVLRDLVMPRPPPLDSNK